MTLNPQHAIVFSQMSCPACGHDDHIPGPCAACTTNGTCWQKPIITGGDGTTTANSKIQMATGTEVRPCVMCRSFENAGRDRVAEHCISRGLKVRDDGTFDTPIAKDFPGRVSLVLDPADYGFCKKDVILVQRLATCTRWRPTKFESELQDKLSRR